MPTLFAYPKVLHQRTQTPPAYRDYRKYKPYLQREFSRRCVYCRSPDGIKTAAFFGADHYRPKAVFAALAADYNNLYYCCNRCNSLKRDFWPNALQRKAGVFVPNPCDYRMRDHLHYRGAEIGGRSTAGKFTIELLELDGPDTYSWRQANIAAFKELVRVRDKATVKVNKLWKQMNAAPNPSAKRDELAAKLAKADQIKAQALKNLATLYGDT